MSAIVAVSLLFTSNIYIPVLFPAFYTHYTKVSQPWHNITYILMRFFAVFVIYMYFEVYVEAQNNTYKLHDCIWFWALLTLCNYSKPSFFLAFAPAVFCVLIICFLQAKGKNLIQSFQIGLPILLSVPILFYQANIVYDESENSSIAFSLDCFLDYIFGKPGQIWVYEISNICFPVFVLVTLLILKYVMHREIELNRVGQGWLMFIIAHLQQLLMIDEGPRAANGNYAWGVYAFGMLLFMVCITDWITLYKNNLLKNKHIFRTGLCIYSLHILCGVIYFIKLCYGEKYIL